MTQQVEAPATEDAPKTEQVEEISDVTADDVADIAKEDEKAKDEETKKEEEKSEETKEDEKPKEEEKKSDNKGEKPNETDEKLEETPIIENEENQINRDGELPTVKSGSQNSVRSLGEEIPNERYKVTLTVPLEKKYSCPQCRDVLRYPMKFEECGHPICAACFHEYLRVEPRCPVDQAPINREKASLDKALNNEIMALPAKCNNHEWGCKWEGVVKDAQFHPEKCDYNDIYCINDCGAKFQRRFLQKHLDKDCAKKIIPCAFCDDRFLREHKKAHLEDCLKVPLPCPNKCDKKLTIPREELDKHIEVDCPRTKIVCQFEEIGCPHRCSREKLPRHYKSGIIEHVRLLYDIVMAQGQRLDQHHELLQDHGSLLETHQKQIVDFERTSRNHLIWRIDEFQRKMKEAKSGTNTTLFSPPFNTSKHGYRLCGSLCLNGDGKGKGTHISAFISILKGAYDSLLKWPFAYRVSFYLLDQNSEPTSRRHIKFSIKPNPCPENDPFLGQPKMEKNASFGGAKFAKHEDVECRDYVKDDAIFLKISVDCDGAVEP